MRSIGRDVSMASRRAASDRGRIRSRVVTGLTPTTSGTDVGGTDVGGTDVGGTDVGGTDVGGTDVGGTDVGGTDVGGTGVWSDTCIKSDARPSRSTVTVAVNLADGSDPDWVASRQDGPSLVSASRVATRFGVTNDPVRA